MDKQGKPKLLLKIGTATLTKGKDKISRAKLEDIAIQIVQLKTKFDVILVCSGAIAAAKQFIKLEKIGRNLKEKQALASIGQPFLMRLIHDSFRDYEIPVGQCLLSYADFAHEHSKQNIINTINILLENGILPIINENDTTSTDEIQFGDNDKLSALTAVLLDVDLLVLATNTYGVYDNHKQTINVIENINDVQRFVTRDFSDQGTGGMQSKLEAAQIAQNNHIESWIVNGHENSFLLNAFSDSSKLSRIIALNKG
ncbi:MAG: glutamate 5-kinase [Aureispira sp.]